MATMPERPALDRSPTPRPSTVLGSSRRATTGGPALRPGTSWPESIRSPPANGVISLHTAPLRRPYRAAFRGATWLQPHGRPSGSPAPPRLASRAHPSRLPQSTCAAGSLRDVSSEAGNHLHQASRSERLRSRLRSYRPGVARAGRRARIGRLRAWTRFG